MESNFQSIPNMAQLLQLAQSPAGQQLLSLLQAKGSVNLQQALALVSAGKYDQAMQVLSFLTEDPEAQTLLKQLGGTQ